jgi:ATP-dependent Clp protease ATP-binding subunit ClpA
MSETADFSPRWLRDLERLLPIRPQFVLAGNIRDHFLMQMGAIWTPVPLVRCLWAVLKQLGFDFLLLYDPIVGLRPYPDEPDAVALASRLFSLKTLDGSMPISLDRLASVMQRLGDTREARAALVIDFASRIARHPDQLSEEEHRFFLAAEHQATHVMPVMPANRPAGVLKRPAFNPVLWLLNRHQDLPSWFSLDNDRIVSLDAVLPDFATRQAAASCYFPLFKNAANATDEEKTAFADSFARATEGLPLTAIADTAQLADRQSVAFADVEDAVQCYKVGVLENPWKKQWLRKRITQAAVFIEQRVKGQEQAVTKTVDILMRSVMGLTGAQTGGRNSNRPRGVLFLAGPTGTGKTELAKTLTQLVFGDERAYIRFDMSEFAEEHTGARLLGAPPGYVGFEAGGELTNAVREKPFSVVLFDEIEKAHPRILDKFLQILEDGRMTDGRGNTAYFSETVLVFTSNLGIHAEDQDGQRVQNVAPGDPYDVVEQRVKASIGEYFKFRLSRPELLNRIGDNIVVFNFITPLVATRIFDTMLANVVARVQNEHGLTLALAPEARKALQEFCVHDLSYGGRGIGNQMESRLVNPLARALFALDLETTKAVTVTAIEEDQEKIVHVRLA